MTTQETLQFQVEDLMDTTNLRCVLDAIVETCYAKAEHLRSNWQDDTSAKEWERAAKLIDATSAKLAGFFA